MALLLFVFLKNCSPISIDDVVEKSSKTRPTNGNKFKPLRVHIGFYLESIGNFRPTEMSFEVDLYVYMSWLDQRLSHNRPNHVLINDPKLRDQMWLPDLYFANARQAFFQEVTVPNFKMFVSNDGTIAYSLRATCSISCALQLRNYPMDKQLCNIRVLSYAHVADEVEVVWFSNNPIRYNPEIGLPEFSIMNMTEGYCNGTYDYALTENFHKSGNFSCLTGNIILARSIGYNLVQSYIPTGLIVMISWVSFWIDRRAVPARVTLSFTTLVSLTTLGNGLRFGLPQVSYAKAIDFWFGACMFFVFCALLEFALINNYMRKAEKFEHISKTFANSTLSRHLHSLDVPKKIQLASNGEPLMYKLSDSFKSAVSPKARRRVHGYERVVNGECNLNGRLPNKRLMPSHEETIMSNELCVEAPPEDDPMDSFSTHSVYDNVSPRTRKQHWAPPNEPAVMTKNELSTMFSTMPMSEESEEESPIRKRPHVFMTPHHQKSMQTFKASTASFYSHLSQQNSRWALRIDKTCRYIFPIGFLLFNLFYWWYYLVWQNVSTEDMLANQILS